MCDIRSLGDKHKHPALPTSIALAWIPSCQNGTAGLAQWGPASHVWFCELVDHGFRQWLTACHCLKQRWLIEHWNIKKKLRWLSFSNTSISLWKSRQPNVCYFTGLIVLKTYRKVSNIRRTMELKHRLSALLQLHLHYQLNTWLEWIGHRQMQE